LTFGDRGNGENRLFHTFKLWKFAVDSGTQPFLHQLSEKVKCLASPPTFTVYLHLLCLLDNGSSNFIRRRSEARQSGSLDTKLCQLLVGLRHCRREILRPVFANPAKAQAWLDGTFLSLIDKSPWLDGTRPSLLTIRIRCPGFTHEERGTV